MEIQSKAPTLSMYQTAQMIRKTDSLSSIPSVTETECTDPKSCISMQNMTQHRSFKEKLLRMLCCVK